MIETTNESEVGFEETVLRQIQMITQQISGGNNNAVLNGVRALEILLSPYHDKQYSNEKNQLLGDIEKFAETEARSHIRDGPEHVAEYQSQITVSNADNFFQILMQLVYRMGLIPKRKKAKNEK